MPILRSIRAERSKWRNDANEKFFQGFKLEKYGYIWVRRVKSLEMSDCFHGSIKNEKLIDFVEWFLHLLKQMHKKTQIISQMHEISIIFIQWYVLCLFESFLAYSLTLSVPENFFSITFFPIHDVIFYTEGTELARN